MLQVVEMLSRMIAPILSFTADEIWQQHTRRTGGLCVSSDFEEGHSALEESGNSMTHSGVRFWREIAVNRELEVQRAKKQWVLV